MTNRERFLSALRGEKADRVPWFADLSYYYFSLEQDGKLPDDYKGDEGYLKFHTDKNVGVCFYAPFIWSMSYSGGVKYTETVKGSEKLCRYETPLGDITSVQKYLASTYSWAYTSHFVKSFEDLKIMLYVHSRTIYKKDYAGFNRIDKLWAGTGIPAALPPICVSPLQKLLSRWAGVENTVELFAQDTAGFSEILYQMQQTEDEPFDIICKSNAQYVEFAENLSSEITGRMLFEMYNTDYYKTRTQQLHESGKFVGIHIDGTLSPCLSMLTGCGFDAAEAVTPAPVGDIEIENLRKEAGDITIIGGMPGALFTVQYSDEFFDAHVRRLLAAFKGDHKFIAGVADQVPPDTVPGRIERVSEIIDKQ